jgi:formamidopyrimidine-DNA glycosylase
MPELAEVYYFSRKWEVGVGRRVVRVETCPGARVFRNCPAAECEAGLTGATLRGIHTHGKQMMFRFSSGWLAVHLGMTGELLCEEPDYPGGRHDHLVLRQKKRALVFRDPRMFGRVEFTAGREAPAWWKERPPAPDDENFTPALVGEFLQRYGGSPLKAVLLRQEGFPGVGNWMADEILWRCGLPPTATGARLTPGQREAIWRETVWVSREALRIIGPDWSDPPDDWLFPHRWKAGGNCPRCGVELQRAEVGGRTTCWCPACQNHAKTRKKSRSKPAIKSGHRRARPSA